MALLSNWYFLISQKCTSRIFKLFDNIIEHTLCKLFLCFYFQLLIEILNSRLWLVFHANRFQINQIFKQEIGLHIFFHSVLFQYLDRQFISTTNFIFTGIYKQCPCLLFCSSRQKLKQNLFITVRKERTKRFHKAFQVELFSFI